MSTLSVRIVPPQVPNFIRVEFGKDKDDHKMLPLTAFDDEQIDWIVTEWKRALLANRERQNKNEELELRGL